MALDNDSERNPVIPGVVVLATVLLLFVGFRGRSTFTDDSAEPHVEVVPFDLSRVTAPRIGDTSVPVPQRSYTRIPLSAKKTSKEKTGKAKANAVFLERASKLMKWNGVVCDSFSHFRGKMPTVIAPNGSHPIPIPGYSGGRPKGPIVLDDNEKYFCDMVAEANEGISCERNSCHFYSSGRWLETIDRDQLQRDVDSIDSVEPLDCSPRALRDDRKFVWNVNGLSSFHDSQWLPPQTNRTDPSAWERKAGFTHEDLGPLGTGDVTSRQLSRRENTFAMPSAERILDAFLEREDCSLLRLHSPYYVLTLLLRFKGPLEAKHPRIELIGDSLHRNLFARIISFFRGQTVSVDRQSHTWQRYLLTTRGDLHWHSYTIDRMPVKAPQNTLFELLFIPAFRPSTTLFPEGETERIYRKDYTALIGGGASHTDWPCHLRREAKEQLSHLLTEADRRIRSLPRETLFIFKTMTVGLQDGPTVRAWTSHKNNAMHHYVHDYERRREVALRKHRHNHSSFGAETFLLNDYAFHFRAGLPDELRPVDTLHWGCVVGEQIPQPMHWYKVGKRCTDYHNLASFQLIVNYIASAGKFRPSAPQT